MGEPTIKGKVLANSGVDLGKENLVPEKGEEKTVETVKEVKKILLPKLNLDEDFVEKQEKKPDHAGSDLVVSSVKHEGSPHAEVPSERRSSNPWRF